jgi:hypothetical protein
MNVCSPRTTLAIYHYARETFNLIKLTTNGKLTTNSKRTTNGKLTTSNKSNPYMYEYSTLQAGSPRNKNYSFLDPQSANASRRKSTTNHPSIFKIIACIYNHIYDLLELNTIPNEASIFTIHI